MTWSHTLLRNGEFYLDAGCMFGLIPRVVWTRWLEPDDKNRMQLQQNALLLEADGKLVLIETGIGDKLSDKELKMYSCSRRAVHDSLQEIGCDPKDISAVVLTHLHFDHAGGLTRRGRNEDDMPELVFPNAEIIVQRQEWEDAIAGRSTMNKTYLPSHLTPEVAERVRLIEGEQEVLPNLTVFPTPGHTWGQQSVKFTGASSNGTNGRTVCFVSDVMPTHYHARPTTNLAYDVEPYTSMLSRIALLEKATSEKWILLPNHDPAASPFYEAVADPEKPREWELKGHG